ncbi:response regulator [bacterium]|nr:response regulator [bacterium]
MHRRSVLIVDDERRMAESLCALLSRESYSADAAFSGHEAVERLSSKKYNLVVTDLRMKDGDGLNLIRHIHDRYPETLIIVITGHASTESAIEALHYHVFDYLRKPFEFDLFKMAIDRAFAKLEIDQLREDMAAMITHDIKIPLTSIIGFASMIHDADKGEFHPRAAEFAETIRANGQKILMLIDNFLTSCQIDAGTLKVLPGKVDIARMLMDVIETARIEAARNHRTIEHAFEPLPQQLIMDEVLVYRAVGNLLQNAIKYGRAEDPIRVCMGRAGADASPLGKESIRIDVINSTDPIGIAELTGLFERYQRAETHRRIEGSGIGLYVVQAVARAHEGSITVETPAGDQIRFSLWLPLIEPAEGA